MSDSMLKYVLRAMAWRRAKGELASILETFVLEVDEPNFKGMKNSINTFIAEIEDNWL